MTEIKYHNSHIGGIEIVEVRPAYSPLPVKNGKGPAEFKRVATLILADGTVVFGCRFDGCDFTSTAAQGINAHFHVHENTVNSKRWAELAEWSLQELVETVLDFEESTARLVRSLTAARIRSADYRDEVTSLKNKLTRREREIDQLKVRLNTFQVQWARKRGASEPESDRVARMEAALSELMERVNSLSSESDS